LSTPSNRPTNAGTDSEQSAAVDTKPAKARSVHRCNFRLAGRLSNEDARALTAIHETLALRLAASLESYLGTPCEVKFDALNQLTVKDYVAEVSPLCYFMMSSPQIAAVELDLGLVFPMIEVLMGGAGNAESADRELSEIEEEMMQDVVGLVMREAQAAWAIPGVAIEAGSRSKPSTMLQALRPTENVTVLQFKAGLTDASGSFSLVLSTQLLDLLIKQMKEDHPQQKSRLFSFPVPPLSERLLDSDMVVTTELPDLKVPVRDLVSLEPGSVLKLRAPIRNPALMTLGGHGLFEAIPVRSGSQRAAQLSRRVNATDWKRR
jgi:flagellar motor switch protein FliM